MGRKDKQVDAGLRNDSYYRATGHDTWNATQLNLMDTTDSKFQSPTVHQVPGETVMIEQYVEGNKVTANSKFNRPHSPDGCEGASEKDSDITVTDVAYASQTSLEEASFAFARDQPGRQSMSEKRHATLDAKSTDTYQRNKKARQEREQTTGGIIGPMLGMKKSSSLESLQTMMTEMKMESGKQANRVKTSRVVRGRGCNESFRAAVDRSYEAQDNEDQPGIKNKCIFSIKKVKTDFQLAEVVKIFGTVSITKHLFFQKYLWGKIIIFMFKKIKERLKKFLSLTYPIN